MFVTSLLSITALSSTRRKTNLSTIGWRSTNTRWIGNFAISESSWFENSTASPILGESLNSQIRRLDDSLTLRLPVSTSPLMPGNVMFSTRLMPTNRSSSSLLLHPERLSSPSPPWNVFFASLMKVLVRYHYQRHSRERRTDHGLSLQSSTSLLRRLWSIKSLPNVSLVSRKKLLVNLFGLFTPVITGSSSLILLSPRNIC